MRFLLSVIDTDDNPGTDAEMAAIDVFNDNLRHNGHWIMACGIESTRNATLIDNRDGAGVVQPGSHIAATEFMSGFWLIEASNRDEALALATAGSLACHRRVEVRALLEG